MKSMVYRLAVTFCLALAGVVGAYAQAPLTVVAAENVYGDIARQIGGERISVTSILTNSDQDPHLFEVTPATVRLIAQARLVIFNGGHYDAWVEKLIKAAPRPERTTISAAQIVGHKTGGNPHLWFAPATMPAVTKAIAEALGRIDPAGASFYAARLETTLASLATIDARVAQMRVRHAGKPITATEPVFAPMTDALALANRNDRFQRAVMNETEPSARDIAAFENDLKERKVRVLIYNAQVSEKLTRRLRDLAVKSKVPVVGITETMPPNVTYQDWVLGALDALDRALSEPAS